MAGFSLGEAIVLRRAMGKKDKREMAQQKDRFVQGALQERCSRKPTRRTSSSWSTSSPQGQRFKTSHAAATVSYHTAYLKANYREEFLAAHDPRHGQHRQARHVHGRGEEMQISHRALASTRQKLLAGAKTIRYSLAALKNIGALAVQVWSLTTATCRISPAPKAATSGRWRRWLPRAPSMQSDRTLVGGGVDRMH